VSIATLTNVATVRDAQPVKRAHVGRSAGQAADEASKMTDMLVAAIPTELVAPYTFLLAAIVGLIDPVKHLHDDQFKALRWVLFGLLLAGTWAWVARGVSAKRTANHGADHSNANPTLEIVSAVLAAAVWALAMPGSPLIPSLHGDNRSLVPVLVLIIGGSVYAFATAGLRQPRADRSTSKASRAAQTRTSRRRAVHTPVTPPAPKRTEPVDEKN
jgi:hypothetical protein